MNKTCLILMAIFFVLINIGPGNATTIQYIATNLQDSDPNQDLWQYSYLVSDRTFSENTGFTIYYEYGLYDSITPVSAPAKWNIDSWDPDPAFQDNGAYDALALVDDPPLDSPFVVNFVWLGNGEPGPQPFEIYYDDGNTFKILESGTTTSSPVPLPSTLLLLISGLAAGLCNRRSKGPGHLM